MNQQAKDMMQQNSQTMELTVIIQYVNYGQKKRRKDPYEKFHEYDNGLYLIEKIRNGEINLFNVKNNQLNFKSRLRRKKGGKKSKEQKNTIYNIDTL